MNFEQIKREFIKLKKEELEYIDNVSKISSSKKLSELEKLEIHRTLNNYSVKLDEILKKIKKEIFESKEISTEIIVEFDVDSNYLSCFDDCHKEYIFSELGVDFETFKFILYFRSFFRDKYCGIDCNNILINQSLIDNPIYIFDGYYDSSEDCYGPCSGNHEDYIYGIYTDIRDKYATHREKISKKKINDFEKDNIIIHSQCYVYSNEIRKIFDEELLNNKNNSLSDCIKATRNRIEELSLVRSPEYKEKVLLDRINELYNNAKGECIDCEKIFYGKFLDVIKETYKLPNEKVVDKEKVIKNDGKNSVIIIAVTKDNKYLITFQNRIKDKIIAEFPSGYIENNENVIEASKRELEEETGYFSDQFYIIDQAYTSPGIDNSISYIVLAKNCIKTDKKRINNTEFLTFDLFDENELKYLINTNIMSGSMNKLAYYNLIIDNEKKIDFYKTINKKYIKKL